MTQSAASGERQALRGYRWQYDHIASLVYDALYDGDFLSVRLTDPEAGRVDDLVLRRRGRIDAFQFKSAEYGGTITFNGIVQGQRTRSGSAGPSHVRSMSDGWKSLRGQTGNVNVHLVMQHIASTKDRLGIQGDQNRPPTDHFASFIKLVLEPLRSGTLTVDEVHAGWQPALARLRKASGAAPDEFGTFLRTLHLDLNAGSGVPAAPSTRRVDIIGLSDALKRRVSESHDVVELDEQGILQLMGWTDRTRLHSRHEFPIDLDTYAPLSEAIGQLNHVINEHDSGYVAVLGPPGSGKSTLLSQALTSGADRVTRYYAYVPKTAGGRTRLTARSFLHDIVLMLHRSGLDSHEREITSGDVDGLRQQLIEQLDSASVEFCGTRRRTIVVVDGLDHVERDYSGNDNLLGELPRPEELPPGVLFVVGSRTLEPLGAHARQQLEERRAIVDLQHHVLSQESVLEVCRRAPITADLTPELHRRIAELSRGYPLALGYLLNRLRNAEGCTAEQILADAPTYQGDIAGEYRAVWDDLQDDTDIVRILTVCSRLRNGFTTEWLFTWARTAAVQTFQRKLLYLFRHHHDGWRFFHDSFRQFAADRTGLGDDGRPDANADARAHGFIAELCGKSDDPKIVAERLFHHNFAGQWDEVLNLAKQERFREQFQQLRSPDLIHEDIGLALNIAAERVDVQAMIRLLLALAEANARTSALEYVDIPSLLYEAGLAAEAIAYCSYDATRVPLAQAYDLAAKLGENNNQAGLRIFRSIEHEGLNDSRRNTVAGHEHDATLSWTRAAALFLPLSAVITALRDFAEMPLQKDRRDRNLQIEQWKCYLLAMETLINAVARKRDETALLEVDSVLGDDLTRLKDAITQAGGEIDDTNTNQLNNMLAAVKDLRAHSRAAILSLATTVEAVEQHLDQLHSTTIEPPVLASSLLEIAEIFADHERADHAKEILRRCPFNRSLTVSELATYTKSAALDRRFRYWRLRYYLDPNGEETPESVAPAVETPAGDDILPNAIAHSDVDAISLASRVDDAIRKLGQLDAALVSDTPPSEVRARSELFRLLDLFDLSTSRFSASVNAIRSQKPELMRIIVAVAFRYGNGIPQQLKDELADRFEMDPQYWPAELKLHLANQFLEFGVAVPWYGKTLAELEVESANADVNSRLEIMADLIRCHSRRGNFNTAQDIVIEMMSTAFGVGYRKDNQFDQWVSWLGLAIAEPDGDRLIADAAWLARLLAAVEPMTEGDPRSAAAGLPAVVVPADPMSAVRIFEYLVRQGTVQHFDALAALVSALVEHTETPDKATIELAADIAAELLAPAADKPFPSLASAIVSAAERNSCGPLPSGLAESMAACTDRHALPTTRPGWREGLGIEIDVPNNTDPDPGGSDVDDIFALVLSDGRRIPRGDVNSHLQNVDDIISMRAMEDDSSNFDWAPVIKRQVIELDDVSKLSQVFGRSSKSDPDVLLLLGEAAEVGGDREVAFSLASEAFESADGRSWALYLGGTRLRAASLIVRLGDHANLQAVCLDLARCATETPWLPSFLFPNFEDIVQAFNSDVAACSIWPEIRTYLDGMAETLALSEDDPLADYGCRWWLSSPPVDRRLIYDSSASRVALAELAVAHISHPSWIVRDRSSAVVVRALVNGNTNIAGALSRFVQPGASDDTLECAGRCMAAARVHKGIVGQPCLEQLNGILATHPSQILRDLSAGQSSALARPLSPKYKLISPDGNVPQVGSGMAFPGPYETIYEELARFLDLNLEAMLRVAAEYATEALALLPERNAVFAALRGSGVRHVHPSGELAASRAAAGRVVADLIDAKLLDQVPSRIQRQLRFVDIELVGRSPQHRPSAIPPPPPAGVDKSVEWWLNGIEDRLSEYIRTAGVEDEILIGASMRLTLLNWDHLAEHYECGTAIGTTQTADSGLFALGSSMTLRDLISPAGRSRVSIGEPLIFKNVAYTFHQMNASWLSLRPDLAATLGWKPDSTRPGTWYTSAGDLAVQSIWWVDGWFGRYGEAFDDTEAQGYAVFLTSNGLREVSTAFGEMRRHFTLTRSGKDNGASVAPVSATRSLSIR